MSTHFDLIIRGGTIVDGTGSEPYVADIAVSDGKIAGIGTVSGDADEIIDAAGLIVTPGFVDAHTHYDAQVTWGQRMCPSSDHGVTTVVMGNCGVGFAPCRPQDREMLVQLMEGVEDIPEIVMTEGLPWNWESYGEYLDSLAEREFDIDVGSLIPHAPVRTYVMQKRGAAREPATAGDMAEMARVVVEGLRAGALGFSTSRSLLHRSTTGDLAPTVTAGEDELLTIARAMAPFESGLFQLIDDFHDATEDHSTGFDHMRHLARASGKPIHFSLVQLNDYPGRWQALIKHVEESRAAGCNITAQVFSRPMGGLLGFDMPHNPFSLNPSYDEIRHLPFEQRIERLRDPELRARLVSEWPAEGAHSMFTKLFMNLEPMFPLGNPVNYTPSAEDTVGARAQREGRDMREVAYDLLLEEGGTARLFVPVGNDSDKSFDDVFTLINHPDTVVALGDGGAHYGMLCDASYPTHLLSYWVRDRQGEKKFTLEQAVKRITSDPAKALGLDDRGKLAEGLRADINVIDLENLKLLKPVPKNNLPANGWRIEQKAEGYRATIVNGVVTYRDGEPTGALPGRLIRKQNRETVVQEAALEQA